MYNEEQVKSWEEVISKSLAKFDIEVSKLTKNKNWVYLMFAFNTHIRLEILLLLNIETRYPLYSKLQKDISDHLDKVKEIYNRYLTKTPMPASEVAFLTTLSLEAWFSLVNENFKNAKDISLQLVMNGFNIGYHARYQAGLLLLDAFCHMYYFLVCPEDRTMQYCLSQSYNSLTVAEDLLQKSKHQPNAQPTDPEMVKAFEITLKILKIFHPNFNNFRNNQSNRAKIDQELKQDFSQLVKNEHLPIPLDLIFRFHDKMMDIAYDSQTVH